MFKSDIEIAQENKMKPIVEIAKKIGLDENNIELYGKYKAKIDFEKLAEEKMVSKGKIILVTAINPTPAGEGKSTTTIGLCDALNKLGKKAIVALREPSLGPVMGVKGGATGGGYSQVVPMEDINLHFTGDIHAITTANNAISALIDNHIYHGNELQIDTKRIIWKRCMDLNDRILRKVIVGTDKIEKSREDFFDITVASEIMAILCLAKNMDDLRERIKNIVIGFNIFDFPVCVGDLGIEGAITMLLKDAIKPNLVQTLEKSPAIIHGGPFANIAHGCNSMLATQTAQMLSDIVVTEAGFGADLGAEKYLNIKARKSGLIPSCIVIVATIRALKMHGGVKKDQLNIENLEALEKGIANLEKHIENIQEFALPYVIAINKFSSDTDNEMNLLMNWAKKASHEIAISEVWEKGSEGGLELANKVLNVISLNKENTFHYLYDLNDSIENKIKIIASKMYGAKKVVFSSVALSQIDAYNKYGWNNLPICMAKTPLSLSDNPKLLGRPRDFTILIRELKPSIGAGFLVCLLGDIMTMPGLPKKPAALNMDVKDGKIIGLF